MAKNGFIWDLERLTERERAKREREKEKRERAKKHGKEPKECPECGNELFEPYQKGWKCLRCGFYSQKTERR